MLSGVENYSVANIVYYDHRILVRVRSVFLPGIRPGKSIKKMDMLKAEVA
jgi:hypothetical protein